MNSLLAQPCPEDFSTRFPDWTRFPEEVYPDEVDIDGDGNGSSVIGDSTRDVDMIISQLTEIVKGVWAPGTKRMTFKNYVQTVRYPGDKRDPAIKELHEKEVANFLNRARELNDKAKQSNPLYHEAVQAMQANDMSSFFNKNKELVPLYYETMQEVEAQIEWELRVLCEKEDPFYEEAEIKMQNKKYKEQRTFQAFLNNLGDPNYKKTMDYYNRLVRNYIDPKTGKIIYKIFPSVVELYKRLNKVCKTSFTLRTLGKDADTIAKAFRVAGIPMNKHADMTPEGMIMSVEKGKMTPFGAVYWKEIEEIKGPRIFDMKSLSNIIGQDNFALWSKQNQEKAGFGKNIHHAVDGLYNGKIRVVIFFDDNHKPTNNPEDKKVIAFPRDIYGRPTSWDARGVMGIKVNTAKVALDKEYLVRKVNKEFKKRGLKQI